MTTPDTIKALRDALTECLAAYRATNRNPETTMKAEAQLDRIRSANEQATQALALTANASEDAPDDCRRCRSYAALVKAKESQLSHVQAEAAKGREAIETLASERQANAILTAELAARPAPVAATPAPTTRRDIFAICDAYESGIGHGLQLDGHKSGAIFGNPECGKAYEIGYEEGEERARGGKAVAPAAPIAEVKPVAWKRITAPGQVKVGDKLRFNIGDDKFSETVKQILHPGTAREELIYNKHKNYYVITSNAITNFGSSKNVEFLETEHAKPEPVEHINDAVELVEHAKLAEGTEATFQEWLGVLPENPTTEYLALTYWAEKAWHAGMKAGQQAGAVDG